MISKGKLSRKGFIKITAITGGILVGGKYLFDLIGEEYVTVRDTRMLMGTIINLVVVAESKFAGKQAVMTTFAELGRQAAIFDHRTSDSPIARLNQVGYLANPPIELVVVLEKARVISEMTGGAFDITVKPLVDLYRQVHHDRSGLPDDNAVQQALTLVGYKELKISADQVELTQTGMAITLDGIAKGYVVDSGVGHLKKLGYRNVFVEAGGDLVAAGTKEAQTPWRVGVQPPRPENSDFVMSFNISDQAVATSGDYMQYYSQDLVHHHIIDPRTGYSAPHIASSTVIAPTCIQADGFATALMVLEPGSGIELMNLVPEIEGLLISKKLEEFRSVGFCK
jgi:thiamine biosynthesis lipoprotein